VAALILVFFIFYLFFIKEFEKPKGKPATEALKSIPYLTWVHAGDEVKKSGVTKFFKKYTSEGLNLYCSRNLSMAHLIDMEGKILHTWQVKASLNESWQHVEACKNGDILSIVKDRMLIRLDWDSQIKWKKEMRFHHDLAEGEDGDIYALVREEELVSFSFFSLPLLNDYILVMTPEGKVKSKISLFKILKGEVPVKSYVEILRWANEPLNLQKIQERKERIGFSLTEQDPFNILHTNTIEIIDRNIEGLCRKGDFLICSLKLDLIGIIDHENEKLLWKWGQGELDKPHHPTLLDNGNILIFDNGALRGYSRILELDPRRKKIIWEYEANPREKFFSISRGSCQRLPNGNTLITESDRGHVFEINPEGKIVWEFFNPETIPEEGKRAAIYRMMRIYVSDKHPWINRLNH